MIGIMSNLIMFPPSFLIVQLFRRSRPRRTRTEMIKKAIESTKNPNHERGSRYKNYNDEKIKNDPEIPTIQEQDKKSSKKKKKGPFTFPWWCKIIAYIFSFMFSVFSVFFIVIKGISFGDEKVTKWLTSFVVSIFTSFLITQPIQVAAVSMLFVFIFRKAEELTGPDPNDDGNSINNLENPDQVKFLP